MVQEVEIKDFLVGEKQPLTVFCGPCVIESEEQVLLAAENLKKIFKEFPFNFVFKSSYDKANRLSIESFRGPGLKKGLKILKKIKKEFDLPIITDVHHPEEVSKVQKIADVIQIPAFLCRQTDLAVAAGNSNVTVNIKKGQFMSPWDMKNIIEKVLSTKNKKIILTDRGTSFGYNNLVSDMRAIHIMKEMGYPVCFDATHSVQLPGGQKKQSGGQKEFVSLLAKAAIASGCNALFLEVHHNPKEAKSDAGTMINYEELKLLLRDIEKLYNTVQQFVC